MDEMKQSKDGNPATIPELDALVLSGRHERQYWLNE